MLSQARVILKCLRSYLGTVGVFKRDQLNLEVTLGGCRVTGANMLELERYDLSQRCTSCAPL